MGTLYRQWPWERTGRCSGASKRGPLLRAPGLPAARVTSALIAGALRAARACARRRALSARRGELVGRTAADTPEWRRRLAGGLRGRGASQAGPADHAAPSEGGRALTVGDCFSLAWMCIGRPTSVLFDEIDHHSARRQSSPGRTRDWAVPPTIAVRCGHLMALTSS